jgi:hypothetical protein
VDWAELLCLLLDQWLALLQLVPVLPEHLV